MKGKPAKAKSDELRVPRQKRSKDRVDAILHAARELIGEKGSSGLKIHEIASRANVTAGSMYQYFPNKNAIVLELAKGYFDQFTQLIRQSLLDGPETIDEAIEILNNLLSDFVQVNKKDTVLRDIWLSVSTDKSIRELDIRNSRANAELIFDSFKHLFPDDKLDNIRRYILLVVQITPTAIRLAMSGESSEVEEYLFVARRMIEVSFRDWVE